MADVTLTNIADRFAIGATVGAYPKSNWPTASLPPSGSPVGSPTDEAVVAANGTLAFTGLAEDTRYFAAQNAAGTRYLEFLAGAAGSVDPDAPTPVPDELFTAKRTLITGVGGRITATSAAGTDYYLGRNAADLAIGAIGTLSGSQAAHRRIEAADYAAPEGYDLFARSRAVINTGTIPNVNVTVGLYVVTNVSGTFTKGALVAGSQHTFTAPAANTAHEDEKEFTLEGLADGLYFPLYQVSTNPAQSMNLEYELEWFWAAE